MQLSPQTGRAIVMMCLASLSYTLNDTITKFLIVDYDVTVIIFVRSLVAMPMLVVMAVVISRERVSWSPRVWFHAIRGATNLLAAYFYIRGLEHLSVAETSVLVFASPCMVTAGSVLLFRERVDAARWAAVIVNFVGVLIAMQPGAGTFQPASFFILAAACLYAANSLTARWIPPQDNLWTVSFFGSAFACLFVAPWTIGHWTPLHLESTALFVGAALCSSFGIGFGTLAYRMARASDLAPFGYSGLIWSTMVTWIVWGSIPGTSTLLGAAVIIASSFVHLRTSGSRRRST